MIVIITSHQMATQSNLIIYISSDYLRDRNNKRRSTDSIIRAINVAQYDIQKDLWTLLNNQDNTYTISTVIAQWSYSLPTDFISLSQIRYQWQPLVKSTKKEINSMFSTISSWTPYYYYLFDNQLSVYPVPDKVGVLDMIYYWSYPIIDSTNGSWTPTDLETALMMRASSILFKQVMMIDSANLRDQEYEKQLMKARAWLLQDENLVFDNTNMWSRWLRRNVKTDRNDIY